jgi:heat shock protein HslJ
MQIDPRLAASVIVFAALALIACAPPSADEETVEMAAQPSAPTIPLEGSMWVLVSYGDPANPTPVLEIGDAVTATFDAAEGRVSGNATCNRYFASYSVEGNSIEIDQAGSTMMACLSPELGEQEQAFLAALGAAETFEIEGDTLRISYDGVQALTLVLLTPIALEGTEWVVTGYNNGKGGVVSVVSGTELTASFADGGVAGSAGCNDYRAGYEIEGESLRIGPAGSTKKMCSGPEGIMEQEAQFLAALSSATVYRIEGDNLELRREDGSLAVKASARP